MSLRIFPVFGALLALWGPGPAWASGEDELMPYKKVPIESAGIELPVPVDWVRLPSGEESGAEALYISVQAKAELDVFSVPFESHFDESDLGAHARQIQDFVSTTAVWENVEARLVEVGGSSGMVLEARWLRMDQPADVMGLALPTEGRTALVLLVMAERQGSPFGLLVSLLCEHTLVISRPVGAKEPSTEPLSYKDVRGFEFDAPRNWRRVLPEEIRILARKAGMSGDGSEDLASTVGFVRPGILRQSPNFIVDMTPSLMPVNEEMLGEFEIRYRQLIALRQTPFTLDKASLVQVAGRESFLMEGRTDVVGQAVRQYQYFVPVEDHSLVFTFSLPVPVWDALKADMASTVESLVILEPAGEEGMDIEPDEHADAVSDDWIATFVLGGTASIVVLILAVLWARRRRR